MESAYIVQESTNEEACNKIINDGKFKNHYVRELSRVGMLPEPKPPAAPDVKESVAIGVQPTLISAATRLFIEGRLRLPLPSTLPSPNTPLPLVAFSSTSSSSALLLKKRARDSEPPIWFKRYLKRKRKEDRAKEEKEDQKWKEMVEIEERKLQAMDSLLGILKDFCKN